MEEVKARRNRVVGGIVEITHGWELCLAWGHPVCRALRRACDSWRDAGRASSRYLRVCRVGTDAKARALGVVGRWEVEGLLGEALASTRRVQRE
eukprot:14215958-Alexandrium_andersonii.AAC.1